MTRSAKKLMVVENFIRTSILEMDFTEAKYIFFSTLKGLSIS